ncbi:hypothetical protein J6590_074452 [Homalodisca vitripennis]|nr:hypothetical protein J6590_074452 [Homalodisca vitripennis]
MFSDIAKKGLIKVHFSPSADSGTAARLTTPASSGAFPGLQETVQTPPMAAVLPSTDYPAEGKYSLSQGNHPPGTVDQGPGVVRITPETSHAAVKNGQGALSRSDVCSANSMRKRQATTDPALPSKCRRTAGDEMEVVREPRIPPVVLDVPKGWASHAVTLRQLLGGDLEAVCTARTLRLKTSTVAHFRSLQQNLQGKGILFHTFSLASERLLKVVIKGLPSTLSSEEVMAELHEEGFNVADAKRLKSRRGQPTSLWQTPLSYTVFQENSYLFV